LCGLGGSAQAGGGAATDAYADVRNVDIDVHGLVDLYSQHDFNMPVSGLVQLRAFDTQADEPSLGLARLTLAHKPDPFGFRLDVGVGDLPNTYLRSDPAASTHPDLSRGLSYIEQAFVTATVPVGRGLQVDIGKFGTPVGLEDNESLGAWNYSRSLLYWLAEPSYHAGLRLTYPVTKTLSFSLFWVNGWDANLFDGNDMRALAGAVTWDPSEKLEVVADYMGGLERAPTRLSDPTLTYRSIVDGYVRYELTKRVSLACTGDYARDAANGGVSWWGVGGYLRVGMLDWLAGSLRAEHYDDGDGFTTGTKQQIEEVTATLEVHGALDAVRWTGRLEYRRDQSDAAFFANGIQGFSNHQDTLGVSLLAAF
jgi:putative OmpL-like beta-barrel porin-2